uniref:Zona pellucida AX n=1 Tax=Acipenser ruthenus TaxID=7906 RepID=A0A1S6PDB2_ACIRT|nr:zona pellucida AX [Acipenser ruthenus]
MSCSTVQQWYPREIVCEENYMEISVRRNVPEIAQEGIGTEDWPAAVPAAQEAFMSVWQVVFHKTGQPAKPMDPSLAHSRGYRINSTSTRILFRSPFNMPESEMLTVNGIQVEAIRATVFYKQRWMVLLVDTSAACTKNNGTFDGMNLAWVSPRVLSPLVLHIEKFQDKGISMGVDGKLLDLATIRRRNYDLKVNETFIQISIPYGAEGGYLKSRVINNQYNRVYAIDLYLEHQWADDQWEATQHRSFKPVRTPFIAETPFVINNTIPEEKVFTVTLGIFNPDVELKNLTINGVPLTLPEAVNQGIVVTEVQHPNGTKSFVLKVPFTHPLIPQKYVGDGVREFTLNINYTLNILPENEPYFHPATIVCQVKDVILPVIKGSCTENSIVFEGTRGNMDYFWVVYIGKYQLTSELAGNRGYIFTNLTKFIVEVPLFSVGCIYEDISLRGLSVRVELTLRSAATLEVVLSSIQRCQFPTKQLLVCMPNGVMTVVAVTMEPIPVVEPSKTTLLDKSCKPKEFDSTRALFTFTVNTCGTRSKIVENYLIYENEVVYTRALFPANAPVITRDSEYRLTIRCRYPLNDTMKLLAERKAVPAPYSGSLEFYPYSSEQRGPKARDVLNLKARLARDVTFSQFYREFPVSKSGLEPLFLEVVLLHHQNLADHLVLRDCWATETPELDATPQWDLVTDGCLVSGDSYKTRFHPVSASALTKSPHHLKRLEVQAQSVANHALWQQMYFHCLAVVCASEKAGVCNETCIAGDKRSARSVELADSVKGYISAGPVQIVPEGEVASVQAAGATPPLVPYIPVLGVAVGVLLLAVVVFAAKAMRCWVSV